MEGPYGKVVQSMAANSTPSHMDDMPYEADDCNRVKGQMMPNNRMNGYITNAYAGPGAKTGAKVKGKEEHKMDEDEVGNDYGL